MFCDTAFYVQFSVISQSRGISCFMKANTMSLIHITDLTFAHDGAEKLFDNVTLQIDTRWKIGLIGRNGRGKTTFFNLLLGHYEYGGKIQSPLAFDYFPYQVPDRNCLTCEIIGAICAEYEPWQLECELSLLGVLPDVLQRPFDTLSGGEQNKTLLAALFLHENRFLLIDEPTNHLDLKGREIVAEYLAGKNGFILISHDRALLDSCVDHVLSIKKCDFELQKGNFSTWQQNREFRERFELSENRKLKKNIKRLGEAAQRTANWSDKIEREKTGHGPVDRGYIGHQSAKMMKRSKSTEKNRQKALDEKSQLLQNIETDEKLLITTLKHHAKRLVDFEKLAIQFGERPVFENLSMTIEAGERIALCGKNGCGKSSLLKLITGDDIPHSGHVRIASGLVISHVPQDGSFLSGKMRDLIESQSIDEPLFKAILRNLGFSREHFENDLAELSAGQKKKILLAQSLSKPAHLYVWDEPLNYIDVISRMQIERTILECQPTLVFVEHDRTFVETVATKCIELAAP